MARRSRKKKTQSIFGAIVIETIAFVGITYVAFQAAANRNATVEESPPKPAPTSNVVTGAETPHPYHLLARGLDTSEPAPTFEPRQSF